MLGLDPCSVLLLIEALCLVESGGDPNAVGDDGEALGILQIHRVYVDDVNRILRDDIYSHNMRMSPWCSKQMFRTYVEHYATENRLGRPPTLEDLARIHNGGPDGYKQDRTLPYWRKVKTVLDELQGELDHE